MSIDTDEKKIDEVLTRGVENIFPNREFLEDKLKKGEQMSIYLGIDPTGQTLHLGHAIILRKLKALQELGHKIILLIGDFTAMIGDPTGKDVIRKRLSHDEIMVNAKLYKKQSSLFLRFDGKNPAEIKYNSKWLSKMNFEDVLGLASHATVDQLLKRDMFQERMRKERPIYVHEFLYPLLQGYDSVAMDVDGEIGGNDQTFNMLMGRTLMKQILEKEKFVIAMKLLEDVSGKKMGKTEENMITFSDSAEEMFGSVMSWTDDMISKGFELCTDIPLADIEAMEQKLGRGENPRDFKLQLAKEITVAFHGDKEAQNAKDGFINTFKEGKMPDNVKEVNVKKGAALVEAIMQTQLVESKSEFRRLINGGAVREMEGEVIKDVEFAIERDMNLKIGKRRFLKIYVQ